MGRGEQGGREPLVRLERADELARGHGDVVPPGGVGHAVAGEGARDDEDAARAQDADRVLDDLGRLGRVAVDVDEVVGAVGEAGDHVERAARDESGAGRAHVEVEEGLPCGALVLALDVDRGEDTVVGHAVEQPEPGDPGAGADLGHRAGADGRGEQAEHRARPGADRGDAQFLGAGPRAGDDLVLLDELLRVDP
jgi:hypothetical protein